MSLPHLWLAAFDHVCLLWFVSQGWMSVWSTTAAAPMYAWTGQSASSASAPLATGSWTKRLVAVNKDTLYRQTDREIKKKNRVAGWLLIKQCVCVCVWGVLLWAALSSLAVGLCLVCPACHSHRESGTVILLSHTYYVLHTLPHPFNTIVSPITPKEKKKAWDLLEGSRAEKSTGTHPVSQSTSSFPWTANDDMSACFSSTFNYYYLYLFIYYISYSPKSVAIFQFLGI